MNLRNFIKGTMLSGVLAAYPAMARSRRERWREAGRDAAKDSGNGGSD